MKNLNSFFRRHAGAFLGALLIGLICVAPQLFSTEHLKGANSGIPYLYQDSEWSYLSRIQEVADGFYDVSSPFLHEYKTSPVLIPPFGEILYVLIARVCGVSVVGIALASKWIFPAVLFLLVYFFYLRLISNSDFDARLSGIAAASVVILGYRFASPVYILSLFGLGSSGTPLSIWTRLVNPITGAILLYSVFFVFLELCRTHRWSWAILGGGLLGLMSGYFFSFAYAATVLTVLCLLAVVQRDWHFVALMFIAFLCSVALNFSSLNQLIATKPTDSVFSPMLRSGLIETHHLLENTLLTGGLLTVLIVFALYYRTHRVIGDREQLALTWCGALLISGFIDLNQQGITGFTIWPQHFVQYTIGCAFVAIIVALYVFMKPLKLQLWRCIMIALIILSFYAGVRDAVLVARSTLINNDFVESQKFGPLIAWMNQNTNKNCTVLVVDRGHTLQDMIPALTSCDGYDTKYVYGVPYERVLHNYLIRLRLQGIPIRDIDAYLMNHQDEVNQLFFADWIELFLNNNDHWLLSIANHNAITLRSLERMRAISKAYHAFYYTDFATLLSSYALDYVVWNRPTMPNAAQLLTSRNFTQEAIVGDFVILRFTARNK